jgi:hypothetical protein
VQSGPERSRTRSLRRQRTLDDEDRSVTIPPARKGTGARDFWFFPPFLGFCAPKQRCRHPSIRTLDERLLRSVQVGCSRFSWCLPPDFRPLFPSRDGSWARAISAVTGTRRWGAMLRLMNLNDAAAGNRTGLLWRSTKSGSCQAVFGKSDSEERALSRLGTSG